MTDEIYNSIAEDIARDFASEVPKPKEPRNNNAVKVVEDYSSDLEKIEEYIKACRGRKARLGFLKLKKIVEAWHDMAMRR